MTGRIEEEEDNEPRQARNGCSGPASGQTGRMSGKAASEAQNQRSFWGLRGPLLERSWPLSGLFWGRLGAFWRPQ